jgi:hypothetical protein
MGSEAVPEETFVWTAQQARVAFDVEHRALARAAPGA